MARAGGREQGPLQAASAREGPAPALREEVRAGAEGFETAGTCARRPRARASAGPPALQSRDRTSSAELEAPAPQAPGTRGLCPRPDASTAAERGAPGPRHPHSGPSAQRAHEGPHRGAGPPQSLSPRDRLPPLAAQVGGKAREGEAARGLSRYRKGRAPAATAALYGLGALTAFPTRSPRPTNAGAFLCLQALAYPF